MAVPVRHRPGISMESLKDYLMEFGILSSV